MQIFELLDRFELLFKTDSFFVDLRKVILNDDQFALFRLVQERNNSALLEGLRKCKDYENFDMSSFSRGQLQSKLWLISTLKELDLNLGTVFLCAGWYATLAVMLFENNIKLDNVRSFDIDPSCASIAETFNKKWFMDNWRFKASTVDIMDFEWSLKPAPSDGTVGNFYYNTDANGKSVQMKDRPDTIINTSCEHIPNFTEWYAKIPENKLVILQSNNYHDIEDHVNCVNTLEEFEKMTPMSIIKYEGELNLGTYKRFMRIGYR